MKSISLDRSILLAIFFLVGLGLVQVYSSSYIFATEMYENGLFFFQKQLLFAAIGLIALFATALMPWKWAQRMAVICWIFAIAGIIATFIPSLSIKAGGATRWIRLPLEQRFEPAELLRITFPMAFAYIITFEKRFFGKLEWPIRLGLVLMPLLLLLKQPDFGSLVMCFLVGFSMLFAFGMSWKYVFGLVMVTVPMCAFLIVSAPYRYARVKSYLDPWADPGEKGFQLIQSLLSFHSGGLTGVGLGQGQGKLFFLPEAHTDFTMAVLGEEIGFIGFAFVVMIYGLLVFRAMQISLRAQDSFVKAASLGISLMFAISVFINIGMVLGMLPTKGLTLPFLSYGGSSLICTCIMFGWLLNMDRMNQCKSKKQY